MILTLLVLILSSTTSISYASSPIVILDGGEPCFDVPPIIENGRTLVPFRAIFDTLGADVSWDPSDQSVAVFIPDGTELTLWIGSKTVSLNGDTFTIDVAPKIINGRTLVPLRVVSEALGAEVDWDQYSRTVTINSNLNNGNIITPPKAYQIAREYLGGSTGKETVFYCVYKANYNEVPAYIVEISGDGQIASDYILIDKNTGEVLRHEDLYNLNGNSILSYSNGDLVYGDEVYRVYPYWIYERDRW